MENSFNVINKNGWVKCTIGWTLQKFPLYMIRVWEEAKDRFTHTHIEWDDIDFPDDASKITLDMIKAQKPTFRTLEEAKADVIRVITGKLQRGETVLNPVAMWIPPTCPVGVSYDQHQKMLENRFKKRFLKKYENI